MELSADLRGLQAIHPSSKPNDLDFEIFTDGSGHTDNYGGSAAVVFSLRHKVYLTRFAAFYGASVNRAELQAFLLGMRGLTEVMDWLKSEAYARLKAYPPIVKWYCDRENLVLSATRTASGGTVYSRRTDADLWAQYEWYEKMFKILPVHIPRNSKPGQAACDQVSSELRTLAKEWAATNADGLGDAMRQYAEAVFENKIL